MSKCIVYININGEKLELLLENSDPSVLVDNSIVQALQENPEALNTLLDNLRLTGTTTDIKPLNIKDIQKNGILANCTTEYIRNMPEYAEVRFPEVNANILLVDSLNLGKVPMYGRVVNSDNEEIIIVKNTKDDIIKLANYLTIKDAIQNGAVLAEDSKYYPKLEQLYKIIKETNKNIHRVEDVILAYLQNKSEFKSLNFPKSNDSVIQFMENLTRSLQNYSLPKNYNSPIVTELNYRKKWLGNRQISIEYNDLYNVTEQYASDLLDALKIESLEDFINLLKEKDSKIANVLNNLNPNLNIQEKDNTKVLYQYLTQSEPDFDYEIISESRKGIILKSDFKPISEEYDISYQTIASMSSEYYKGYRIYNKDNSLYFISRGSLIEESTRKPAKSLEEAKMKIDSIVNTQTIKDNSFIEFMFRDTYIDTKGNKRYSDTYSENISSRAYSLRGQIIGVLNIPIDPKTSISGNEAWLLNGDYTINDFYKIINTYKISDAQKKSIKNLIDTPQKAAAFIYKVNEELGTNARNSGTKLYKIAKTVSDADIVEDKDGVKDNKNYYYVEDISKFEKTYTYKLIKTNLDELRPPKPDKSYPSLQWFNAIAKVLNDEFRVKVNIVTSSEVKETFKNIADPNIDKAFIYNGEVYINSTIASSNDLLHEYVHLILGVLKSNPELFHNYEELVRGVYYSEEGETEKDLIKDAYPGLSEMDIMEEVFCNLFSNYIRKRINRDTAQIFKSAEEKLKEDTSTIFNTPISSFEDFYSKSIDNVFGKFKKEVSYMLQYGGIDFGSTKKPRQITNWISEQIKKGNITENC